MRYVLAAMSTSTPGTPMRRIPASNSGIGQVAASSTTAAVTANALVANMIAAFADADVTRNGPKVTATDAAPMSTNTAGVAKAIA